MIAARRPGPLPAARRAVGYLIDTVLVQPVREGRLRDIGWPPGLRGAVAAGFGLAAALIAVAGLSSVIRGRLTLIFVPPEQSLPRVAAPVIIAALFLATGTLYAALLHVRIAVRVPGLLFLVLIMVRVAGFSPGRSILPALGGCLLMIIFAVLRRRASFGWGEFVIAQLIVSATLSTALVTIRLSYQGYAPALVLTSVDILSGALWVLAAPFAVLAGVAITELTIGLALAVSRVISRPRSDAGPATGPARAGLAVVGLLIIARVVQVVFGYHSDPGGWEPVSLIGGVLTVAVPLLLVLLLRRRFGHRLGALDGPAVLADWRRWALPAAAMLAGTALWSTVLIIPLRALQLSTAADLVNGLPTPVSINTATVVAAIGLAALAVLGARRSGRVVLILLLLALLRLIRAGFQLTELPASYTGAMITADLLAVVLAASWWARGGLTGRRLTAVAAVIVITGLYDYRHVITEPITALLALSGALVGLLVGAVWRLLTDNGYAAGDSGSFPRPARVLLVLANAVFGTTMIALVALQGGISDIDLESLENLGDLQLGGDLKFSVLVVIIAGGLIPGRTGPGRITPADAPAGRQYGHHGA